MTQKTRLKNLEDFGYGPNVMRNTKVCAKCGQVIKASASLEHDGDGILEPREGSIIRVED